MTSVRAAATTSVSTIMVVPNTIIMVSQIATSDFKSKDYSSGSMVYNIPQKEKPNYYGNHHKKSSYILLKMYIV